MMNWVWPATAGFGCAKTGFPWGEFRRCLGRYLLRQRSLRCLRRLLDGYLLYGRQLCRGLLNGAGLCLAFNE